MLRIQLFSVNTGVPKWISIIDYRHELLARGTGATTPNIDKEQCNPNSQTTNGCIVGLRVLL